MTLKPIQTNRRASLARIEKDLEVACAAASTRAEAYVISARAHVDDPRLMRKTIARLRKERGLGRPVEDAERREIDEWWCSEQRIRDMADPSSCFDGSDQRAYGGGPPIFHPHYGPREPLEQVRDLVNGFRLAASRAFPLRTDLEEVYRTTVSRNIIELPAERWGEGWDEKAWIAFLYIGGMRALSNVPMWIGKGNWPHALRMMLSAKDHLYSMERAELRPKLLLAQRETQRVLQLAEFQKKGATARRRYGEDDRAAWLALYASDFADHTARRAAELIAARLNLNPSAAETIRKELGKQNG